MVRRGSILPRQAISLDEREPRAHDGRLSKLPRTWCHGRRGHMRAYGRSRGDHLWPAGVGRRRYHNVLELSRARGWVEERDRPPPAQLMVASTSSRSRMTPAMSRARRLLQSTRRTLKSSFDRLLADKTALRRDCCPVWFDLRGQVVMPGSSALPVPIMSWSASSVRARSARSVKMRAVTSAP